MLAQPRVIEETAPRISSLQGPDKWVVTLDGCWSAAALAQPQGWDGLQHELSAAAPHADVNSRWDLRAIERLDHSGAQLLWNSWGRQWPAEVLALPAQRAMIDRVARYSVVPPPAQPRSSATSSICPRNSRGTWMFSWAVSVGIN